MKWRPIEIFLAAVLSMALIGFAGTVVGCASVKQGWSGTYSHRPLLEQIVRMRPGYKGLTHQICAERDWFGECKRMDLVEYNLQDQKVRANFVALQFRCKIGGYRYKFYDGGPYFARYKRQKKCWLCKTETVIEKTIPMSNTQYLIDAGTYCWSEQAYPDGVSD